METISNIYKALTTTNSDLAEMTKQQAFRHFSLMYPDDESMVASGMKRWQELNPSAKGRSAAKSAEK